MQRKSQAKEDGEEVRLKVRVLGAPSPEALRQAYKLAAKKLVREMAEEQCELRSTSE